MKPFYSLIFSLFLATHLAASSSTSGLHLDWLNPKINPSQNFYEFANGTWQKQNPIPAAYSYWSVGFILQEQNIKLTHQLVEDVAKSTHSVDSVEEKLGNFYQSGMDETTIEKLGATPLQAEFSRIDSMNQVSDLQPELAHLQLLGVDAPFSFDQMQDFTDSKQVIGVASQSGLGLPDRDYYLKKDKKSVEIRKEYQAHIGRMFKLLGDDAEHAQHAADVIMSMETAFAKASLSQIEQRDPHAVYHLMTLDQLQKITPHFDWKLSFADLGYPNIKQINLATPKFFAFMDMQLNDTSLDDWKTYLRWHLLHATAPFLSKPFVNETFCMTKKLTGKKELLPRWRRVMAAENNALGFAIGKLYVEKMFPTSSKQAVQKIVDRIHAALEADLKTVAWMTPETRQAALNKLRLMHYRIGYPNKWRDYSALQIDRGPYVLNVLRSSEFLKRYALNKMGKPVNKDEWDMLPQQVNAYYDPSRNEFNLPAGILQSPFYSPDASEAVNYGAIGAIIGHEMTHAFDDEGAKFDGQGNLKNWWTKEDVKKFQSATACIVDQFSQYKLDGLAVQGKLVAGEAIADLSGISVAYNAFHALPDYAKALTLDGTTPDQQFFLSYAHAWAANMRPEQSRLLIIVDPHPPMLYRVNGTIANMPQFQAAFALASKGPMINQNRCRVW